MTTHAMRQNVVFGMPAYPCRCHGNRSLTHPSSPRGSSRLGPWRQRQRGVVAIEYALLFVLGVIPLLLLTFSGIMIFAAKQSLALAAADGARAALQYQPNESDRLANATSVAGSRMQWLLNFSQTTAAQATSVSSAPCASDAAITCVTVVAKYDYDTHPFLPGTEAVYGWVVGNKLESTATIQLPSSVTTSNTP